MIIGSKDATNSLNFGVSSSWSYHAWIQASFDNSSGSYGSKHLLLQPVGGSVGIGTTNPGAKLEVNGNIKIGGGTPITKIIAGRVNANGSKISGSGFTCTRLSDGKYRITFSSAFSSTPVALACGHEDSDHINTVKNVSTHSMEMWSLETWKAQNDGGGKGEFQNTDFSFIAVGV